MIWAAPQPVDCTGGPARNRTWDQLIMSQRKRETESTSEHPSNTKDEDLDEE
jgi:hypothetical protein